MASNLSTTHFLRTLNKRHYASAAAKFSGAYGNDMNVTNLSNNTIVASTESAWPISRLSVTIKAGSRYDPQDLPGLNHVLRSSAGLTTSQSTRFGIMRNIQQLGANISCTGTRDNLTYTLEATCDKLPQGLKFFRDVIVNQVFKPWELEENAERIKYELSLLTPETKVVDLLHKVAYRTGLGNSMYVDDFEIGRFNSESLQYQVSSLFTSSRTAVVGVGVDHSTVSSFAEDLELPTGSGLNDNAAYKGGDLFLNGPTPLTYIAVAAESAGLNDNDVWAFNVLRYALGGWSTIKWSEGNSPFATIAKKFKHPTVISALNAVHSDSGLFGFVLATLPSNAKDVALETGKYLQTAKLTDNIVNGAKNRYINDVSERTGEDIAFEAGNQLLHTDNPLKSIDATIDAISRVSTSDVNQALSQFGNSKKSVVSYGRLEKIPYSEDFK